MKAKKYYVIKNLQTGFYYRNPPIYDPDSNTTSDITRAEEFDNELDAFNCISLGDTDIGYFTVIPVWEVYEEQSYR